MEKMLSILRTMPEYAALLESVIVGESAAVTGISQINRSHLIAGLHRHTSHPIVVICHDDMAAKRLQEELGAFLGSTVSILPTRELTLYDSAVVSRGWEQKRLRQLYDLCTGKTNLQILSWEALSQRTMPASVLRAAAFTLETGNEYTLSDLLEKLNGSGYSRCGMVEGPGQFAVRGGILDIFSPAADRPIRAEFFGDELDTMGFFDPDTQRRTENVDSVVIVPVGETQPKLHTNGLTGLCDDLRYMISRQKRRKNINEPLLKTLERDLEKYENNLQNPASDRYMALIYQEMATAMDYIPKDAVIVLCNQSNLHRAARTRTEEMGMQLDSFCKPVLLRVSCAIMYLNGKISAKNSLTDVSFILIPSLVQLILKKIPQNNYCTLMPSSYPVMVVVWILPPQICPTIRKRTFQALFYAAADVELNYCSRCCTAKV